MLYSLKKIATLIGAHCFGSAEGNVGFLLTDSRSLSFPEETLFFALRSERNDGHRYIGDLYNRGVRAFVVSQQPAETYPDATFLVVNDTLLALQRLAERHRDTFNIPVIGITGSNGKTVVKEWLYQILSSRHVTRSPRSYNSQTGVPLSVWRMHEDTDLAIFEAGISQCGEMERLREIIQPTIGIFTCLGQAHQENFQSMEEKCQEKMVLFRDADVVIYPMDDEIIATAIRQQKGTLLSWSKTSASATLFVDDVKSENGTMHLHYIYNGSVEGEYTLPYISEASVDDSIICALTALHLGLTPDEIAAHMAELEPVAMRLEVKQGQHDCILINDSYNSDLASLDIALDFMHRRPEQNGRSRTLIISDIDQTGIEPAELYRHVADMIESRGIDEVIGIGPQISQYLHTSIPSHYYDTTEDFLNSLNSLPRREGWGGSLILIKGARRFAFDRITDLLVEKVHETTLEVNLSAIVNNLNWYRSQMEGKKLVCMIKADGYGAGAIEIAKTLQDHRVDYLAVAVADEGVALRKAGITANIMIMNPEMTAFKTMFDWKLEPEVYSFRLLDALRHAARKEGITGYPVHIKLDTGMHRLGFHPIDDMDRLIDYLKNQNALTPRSVFSHFVGSDDDCFDDFSAQQFDLYEKGSQKLLSAFDHKILRHICNSAGIEHFPGRQLDMCRLGLGLYGINPRNNGVINNVSTLKTTILQLRHVPAGESVGYSRRTILDRDSVIAAIPIGYADGLNRRLGNRNGYCLVNGQQAQYVGNICMDVCMIDVTDIPCHEGDSVEIFGDNLPVTVLSDTLGTIPYEVLTGISNRVKRVYFQD